MEILETIGNVVDGVMMTLMHVGAPREIIVIAMADVALNNAIAIAGSEGARALIDHMAERLNAIERGEFGAERQALAMRGSGETIH